MSKLKVIIAALCLFITAAYFTWAAIMVYLVTDISEYPNIKLIPELVTTTSDTGNQKLNKNIEMGDFGVISAKIDTEGIIQKSTTAKFPRKIEYPEYIFSFGPLKKVDTPEASFEWMKGYLSTVPSDVLSFNSLRENNKIVASLMVKAIAFGSGDVELGFIQIIDEPNLKAIAYLYKDGSKKEPFIQIDVYPNDKYLQTFKFESKSDSDAVIKARYSDFVKSVKGAMLSENEYDQLYSKDK